MIHYQLRCRQSHHFDGWFKDSASFDKQAELNLVECPECGNTDVERALMTPAVAKKTSANLPVPVPEALPDAPPKAMGGRVPAAVLAMLQKIRTEVERSCDYVGDDFADEARRMHRGEIEQRPIYGEASEDQAESLVDEGIDIARIPWVSRADG